jgi:ABC-type molybdate transport system substrate-binding protein
MGHPLKLREQGRATTVAMFARNTLCAVATPHVGLTTANVLDKRLDPAVKLGTSTPKADPAGDSPWAMFRLADTLRPGSLTVLDAKAQQMVGGALPSAPASSPDPTVTALRDGGVDMSISYCTSARLRWRQLPTLHIVDIPASLQVGPEYGLALL